MPGSLNRQNNPYAVTVTQTGTTVVFSRRLARAALLGPSPLHSGYAEWDITGPATHGDLYHLSTPLVPPPPGGFFDADLQILFSGGQNGNIQIPCSTAPSDNGRHARGGGPVPAAATVCLTTGGDASERGTLTVYRWAAA